MKEFTAFLVVVLDSVLIDFLIVAMIFTSLI
nr:MAG TPA: hypothetical protein [Caudoviricetes sp.]